jgi:hypothetical protein
MIVWVINEHENPDCIAINRPCITEVWLNEENAEKRWEELTNKAKFDCNGCWYSLEELIVKDAT